jgi:hypothetical protein
MQPPHLFRFSQRSESSSGLSRSLTDTLSTKDRVDAFSINVSRSSRFRASLTGSRKANVNLELVNAAGTVTRSSQRGFKTLDIADLPAGRYRLRAVLKSGQFSRYQLRYEVVPLDVAGDSGSDTPEGNGQPGIPNLPPNVPPSLPPDQPIRGPIDNGPDLGGNSLATATNRGRIGAGLTLTDNLGDGDPADWYQFTVGDMGSSRLNLTLDSVNGAGLFARVYSAADLSSPVGDVAFERGKSYQNKTSLAVADGTYYVKVSPIAANSQLTYNLRLQETAIPDRAGNTAETAVRIQSLHPGGSFTATDFVGQGDIFDYYTFTTAQPITLNMRFERLGTDHLDRARILYELDRVGAPSSQDWISSNGTSLKSQFVLTTADRTLSGRLAPGTYKLQLKSFFSNGDNPYRMTISAAAP